MFGRQRRQRRMKKVKAGDGRPLKRYRWWQVFSRTVFLLDHTDDDGATTQYAVDVDYFELEGKVALYKDGRQEATAVLPASFPTPIGAIDVETISFGLKRMHLVREDGSEQQLRPQAGTPEHWRARFGHRHPRAARVVAGLAIVILLGSLVVVLPQALEMLTQIDWIAENVGTFTSPISLPTWLNTTLLVAGIVAALERALTLRNHWLIDMDTWMFGD